MKIEVHEVGSDPTCPDCQAKKLVDADTPVLNDPRVQSAIVDVLRERRILALRDEGLSYAEIAARLSEEGYPPITRGRVAQIVNCADAPEASALAVTGGIDKWHPSWTGFETLPPRSSA